jgi:hypothetical protein
MYIGIAAAPLLGAVVLGTGMPDLVPVIGSVLTVLGLAAFLVGYRLRGRLQTPAEETAAIELAEEAEGAELGEGPAATARASLGS